MLLLCITDLERIEDQYPELTFWGIEVPNCHYHGHVEGSNVYINLLQPDIDWLLTALHETVHYEYDSGDISKVSCCRQALMAEGFARRESEKELRKLIGERNKSEVL